MTVKSNESPDTKSRSRSTADIQAEIDVTRERLVQNLNELKARTKPQVLMEKAKVAVSGVFVDAATGEIRTERVVVVAVSVVGFIVVRKTFKARSHRRELRRLGEVVWVPVPRSSVSTEFAPVVRTAAELSPLAIAS